MTCLAVDGFSCQKIAQKVLVIQFIAFSLWFDCVFRAVTVARLIRVVLGKWIFLFRSIR